MATQEVRSVTKRSLIIEVSLILECGSLFLKDNRETGYIISLPEGGRGVGDGAVEVDGEGDHVEEEAGQGPQQGDGGEQERGRGTPG